MVLGYLKYLYFRLFKLYSKLEAKNPHRMALNSLVLLLAFDLLFLYQLVFFKEKFVNPLFLVIAVVITLVVHFLLSGKQRYLKLLEGIDQHKTKRNVILFWIHLVITALLFFAVCTKYVIYFF